MLGNVQPTEFDLRFSIFGIPVRVHPMFWLLSILLLRHVNRLDYLFVGVFAIFISILVHELGHAMVAKWYGWDPRIVLYYFGGLAYYEPLQGNTLKRSILISLAGPAAGFLLYGTTFGALFLILLFEQVHHLSDAGQYVIELLLLINLWWNLFNLLPIYPLDGGQVARAVFMGLMPNRGLSESLKLSVLTGGAAAGFLALYGYYYAALFCVAFAVASLMELQSHSRY